MSSNIEEKVDLSLDNDVFVAKYGRKKAIGTFTLGCKVNQYETDAMQQLFEARGYQIVPFDETADIFVINTCTVTNVADRKSRQILHRVKRLNPNGITVAVGCYVQASKETLEEDSQIDIIIGNNKKQDIVRIVEEYLFGETLNEADYLIDIGSTNDYESLEIEKVSENTRAYIKIQDGCNQFCSYCIIPFARGRVRSREKNDIIQEVLNLVKNGYKEIVLTGIHLASYGIDLDNIDLLTLTEALNEIEGLKRIRFGSLEPTIITEAFAVKLSQLKKVCPHFHLSLQSGSNATLKRMNRKYTTEIFQEKSNLLRQVYEQPAITTDIIVGFPGETDEEFRDTAKFLEKIAFSDMHIFKYSVRKGTRAEKMPDQVNEGIKNTRSGILIQLAKDLTQQYKQQRLGVIEEILIEECIAIDGINYLVGHTTRYEKIYIQSDEQFINEIRSVQLVDIVNDKIIGKLL